jgi:soluble lytic murein transglycosylase-like protein
MDRLYFGARARRRARFKRVLFWMSLLSTAAMFAGIPGTGGVFEAVDRFGSEPSASSIETTETMTSLRRFQSRMYDTRPKPTPTPSPAEPVSEAPAGNSVVEIIHAAAERHGLDGDYLVSIAECESGLDPSAYNAAGYHGLFQFDQTTWAEFGAGSITDPVAQAEAAASLIAAGQSSRWPVCA